MNPLVCETNISLPQDQHIPSTKQNLRLKKKKKEKEGQETLRELKLLIRAGQRGKWRT